MFFLNLISCPLTSFSSPILVLWEKYNKKSTSTIVETSFLPLPRAELKSGASAPCPCSLFPLFSQAGLGRAGPSCEVPDPAEVGLLGVPACCHSCFPPGCPLLLGAGGCRCCSDTKPQPLQGCACSARVSCGPRSLGRGPCSGVAKVLLGVTRGGVSVRVLGVFSVCFPTSSSSASPPVFLPQKYLLCLPAPVLAAATVNCGDAGRWEQLR